MSSSFQPGPSLRFRVFLSPLPSTLAGGVVAVLEVLPAEEMGFLDKNRQGITMMFGVIIASGVVKFLRFVAYVLSK